MVVSIAAGQLRRRVVIQRDSGARNSFGVTGGTFTTLATVWASISTASGGESQQAEQTKAEANVVFTMRYYSGLTTRDQFVWDSRTFRITAIDDVDGMNVKHIVETVEAK